MPLGARILAAADTWAERSRRRPGGPEPQTTATDPACLAALPVLGQARHQGPPAPSTCRPLRPSAPASSRCLRLLAEGCHKPGHQQGPLHRRRTVEHHVEHILAKLGR